MAICVILSLTAIILTKDDQGVETGVKGMAESIETVEEVLKALKFYSKDADNIIGYLYLFDFFKV